MALETFKYLNCELLKQRNNKSWKEIHNSELTNLWMKYATHLGRDFIADVKRGNHPNLIVSDTISANSSCDICSKHNQLVQELKDQVLLMKTPLLKSAYTQLTSNSNLYHKDLKEQQKELIKLVEDLDQKLTNWKAHLWLTGNQYKEFEKHIELLQQSKILIF